MNQKSIEMGQALKLRREGHTYNEIARALLVSKSSLSAWLKDMPLTENEKKVLKWRKDANITRGRIRSSANNRLNRLEREKQLFIESKRDFDNYLGDPLFFCGVSLYWAEGAKRSSTFQFMNSDKDMIRLMMTWCRKFMPSRVGDIRLRLYIHQPYAHENCEAYWSKITELPLRLFSKTIYKPTSSGVKMRPAYKGCLRIEIRRGLAVLRKMQFWRNLMLDYLSRRVV
ncbi:MAG: hypothetical protein A2928_03650 [Candidatus Taylorbacteria bacterium RIFCSPLOWO2_01_FULL_45_15b]|uniref:Uncharacterized protein n=1 Tax=Candidatus Taylorbacteria bacterium RIFCSPLOWO2_01_FULL_45_15b TaxID=1802319 RepID=A0A1G2NH33_9BACT|nr:MAG: hypothetical protein A2928_03650 [Candidatus Taylorbacteria bacterium RIFCSPLOWO2_01_FULL_45_15b]